MPLSALPKLAAWSQRARSAVLTAALCVVGCSQDANGVDDSFANQRQTLTTPIYRINSGGGAVSPFSSDQFVSGGWDWTTGTTVSTSGVANAAPASVYQSERYGNFTYAFPNLTPGASYTVRLHFAETKFSTAGMRRFNVLINGATALSNFDIFAAAGFCKAYVQDFDATASASGQISVQYVTLTDNAKASGVEILQLSGSANQPPTVATAATASANPTSGTSVTLNVLGADDGGEGNLTYTWSSAASSPGSATFSLNGTNSAKTTTATFSKAGTYPLTATIKDANGATVTSNVSVVVQQKLSQISVSPASASVSSGGSQQFSAVAKDQFGDSLSSAPSIAWTVSGGGSINTSGTFSASSVGGPFTVTATSSGVSGTATVSVTAASQPPAAGTFVYRINSGGGSVSPFSGDQLVSGGNAWDPNATVSTSGVAKAGPAAIYSSERWGNHTYTLGGLVANDTYIVRLHFAETKFTTAGARRFNVNINGSAALSNFDIFAQAGANKALVLDFTSRANASGQIVVQYVGVTDNAKSSGIEVLTTADGDTTPQPPGNRAPTVVNAAASSANPVTGTSSALSVLGADDGGEGNLTYTWAVSGSPPASVAFSSNGSNASKNTTATFSQSGSYALVVTLRDAAGATATSSLNLNVNQQLGSITVSPGTARLTTGGRQQFLASAKDQFGSTMTTQPAIAWSATGGTIDNIGQYTAGTTPGTFTVTASSGGKAGTSSVTVASNAVVTYTTDFNGNEAVVSEGGAWTHLGVFWTKVATSGGLAYGTQAGNGNFDDSYAYLSGFPPDQMASGVVHLDANITTNTTHEVEILLRWSDTSDTVRGYEANFAYNGQYQDIVRWNGPRNSFTYLVPSLTAGIPGGLHEGDTVSAKIVGKTITTYVNGQKILSVDDDMFSDGNPGMGFFRGGPSNSQSDFAFTRFTATSVSP